jgi:hypothetical protein
MMKKFLITLLAVCCTVLPLTAQSRGGGHDEDAVEIVDVRRTVTASGKQWAVFIAIDEYREWEPLFDPVKDAKEIKNILLEHYYFDEVREIYNRDATAASIRRLFIELQDKTGPNDSVFVFHAGHGINEGKTKTPAWIPYDGGEDIYTQANWLSHLQVRSMLDSLKARHVFLISDSCFSGDLLDAARGTPEAVNNYPAAYDRVSRQAMSSGASEKVDDVSEFASRLKNTLLRTETPYITPDYLLSQIKEAQTTRQLSTIPMLAAIPRSGHQLGGSFLFFRKNPKQQNQIQESAAGSITSTVDKREGEPIVQGRPGEFEYFIGTWLATTEYNDSYDTYRISFFNNGRCTVTMSNDTAEQETTGNWSWDGQMFKLNAVFRNGQISYQRNIQWVSIVSFAAGNNSFYILARPTANAPITRFTFFRE